MEWTIKIHYPERIEHDGNITPECTEEYTIPFKCSQIVYYAHKKKFWKKNSNWVLTKSRVVGVWATNTYGVEIIDNEHIFGNRIDESQFKYLFTDRDEAIEFCLKKNAQTKVKIYGE